MSGTWQVISKCWLGAIALVGLLCNGMLIVWLAPSKVLVALGDRGRALLSRALRGDLKKAPAPALFLATVAGGVLGLEVKDGFRRMLAPPSAGSSESSSEGGWPLV